VKPGPQEAGLPPRAFESFHPLSARELFLARATAFAERPREPHNLELSRAYVGRSLENRCSQSAKRRWRVDRVDGKFGRLKAHVEASEGRRLAVQRASRLPSVSMMLAVEV
jgi:hypothetical protein